MTTQRELDHFFAGIRSSWSDQTSQGEFNAQRPSTGQCAVTALVLQDYLGGELTRTLVEGESHYWLRTPTGEDIDLTADQFDVPVPHETGELRTREYVLSNESTQRRYAILSQEVRNFLVREHVWYD